MAFAHVIICHNTYPFHIAHVNLRGWSAMHARDMVLTSCYHPHSVWFHEQ